MGLCHKLSAIALSELQTSAVSPEFFGKNGVMRVVFCGAVVVNCVADVDSCCTFSAAKNRTHFSMTGG